MIRFVNSQIAGEELFAFTGRVLDPDTAICYNQPLHFDPAEGQWLSEDAIGYAAAETNLYRYVGDAPTQQAHDRPS